MKALASIGTFVGGIAGIVIIKYLDLPGVVTFLLVAGLLLGMIVLIAKLMADGDKKKSPAENLPSSDKA